MVSAVPNMVPETRGFIDGLCGVGFGADILLEFKKFFPRLEANGFCDISGRDFALSVRIEKVFF